MFLSWLLKHEHVYLILTVVYRGTVHVSYTFPAPVHTVSCKDITFMFVFHIQPQRQSRTDRYDLTHSMCTPTRVQPSAIFVDRCYLVLSDRALNVMVRYSFLCWVLGASFTGHFQSTVAFINALLILRFVFSKNQIGNCFSHVFEQPNCDHPPQRGL